MAGNSLAEAVVFGRRAALSMAQDAPGHAPPMPEPDADDDEQTAVRTIVPDAWERLRAAMTNGAGLVRTEASLRDALAEIQTLATGGIGSLRAAAVAASLVCRSALVRDESRGTHFRADAPEREDGWDQRHVTLQINREDT